MTRTAIFHDNLVQMGGAERVLDALMQALPDASLHTTLTVPEKLSPALRASRVHTTWMQHLPARHRLYRHYFLLYPLAIETTNMRTYDLIVSSCWGYSKGVRKRRDAIHVCYCHTPMRWVWRYHDYVADERLPSVVRRVLPRLIAPLRTWDLQASRRPDFFIANSEVVRARIRRFYDRDAVVIPPPVDVRRFHASPTQDDYYLVVSRLVAYKRIQLAIRACNLLKRRLVIIGDGPDRQRLQALAGPTVELRGRRPDAEVSAAAAECRAVIFAGEEDFGLVPLEANASGRPVVAWRGGGALETVRDGETGLFFDEPTPESLAAALLAVESRTWDQTLLRAHAAQFDVPVFIQRIQDFLRTVVRVEQFEPRLEASHA
ncbi:MAG: glycosyltransferase [Vicinamibacterales bacterium]